MAQSGSRLMLTVLFVVLCQPPEAGGLDDGAPGKRGDVYVCDRRMLDATCFEFRVGEAFAGPAEIEEHCRQLGFGGQEPIFRAGALCPEANRVGRCVEFHDPFLRDEIYGTKHYYTGIVDRWDWSIGGFAPTCRKLDGRVVPD